jgi:hypothetical protein
MVAFAESLKQTVWVASGTVTDGVRQFGTPVLHLWNCRTLNMGVGLLAFGPNYMDYRKVVTTNAEVTGIKQLDRAWIGSVPSGTVDPLARDADFYIISVVPGVGGVAEIAFKRLSEDDSGQSIS